MQYKEEKKERHTILKKKETKHWNIRDEQFFFFIQESIEGLEGHVLQSVSFARHTFFFVFIM